MSLKRDQAALLDVVLADNKSDATARGLTALNSNQVMRNKLPFSTALSLLAKPQNASLKRFENSIQMWLGGKWQV